MAQKPISDEELQFKKRARRRLVGAIALMIAAVVFLPMVLDKEPRPVGQDIAIRIPSQEKTPFQAPNAAIPPAQMADVAVPPPAKAVEAKPSEAKPSEGAPSPAAATPAAGESPAGKPETQQPAAKVAAKTEPEAKPAAHKASEKAAEQAGEKSSKPEATDKSAKPAANKHEPVAKHEPAAKSEKSAKSSGYVILLGAFSNLDNAKQRQAKLTALGVRYYSEKIKTSGGEKLRVRAGPYATRAEAEKVLGRLKAQGIQDGIVAEKDS